MDKKMYRKIEEHMLSCMNDGAHDRQHIYRVLYYALELANGYDADEDVLIAAALLHDIGRDAQYKNPECDHALEGAGMAYDYLSEIGWDRDKAAHVRDCIVAHRYRSGNPPASIEAKLLFDADKLDVAGAMGIARTLAYQAITSEPFYSVDENGGVPSAGLDSEPSFFKEYDWKLKNLYDKFFTNRAKEIAAGRRKAAADFYESMYNEAREAHECGRLLLKETLK